MNRFLQTLIVAAPMVIAAPYVAAETHPAQKQMQQNIDTVLKIATQYIFNRSATCETG